MPKTVTHFSALVASPGDVAEERDLLEDVVRELNQTVFSAMGTHLELVRWETHAVPSAGADPQSTINEQLGDDFDIFIGILWHRFGTPTPRAGSGTAEEFERAYSRYQEDSSSIAIMVYFKSSAIPIEELSALSRANLVWRRERVAIVGGCDGWS
jgi:hypothetical protein